MVPQGSADERPLHGAPVYYYPTGRSLPKNLQDRGALKGAVKWNEDGGLIDVEELEEKEKEKKRWYDKGTKNESVELDQKGPGLSLEVFRQDSSGRSQVNEELPGKESSRRVGSSRRESDLGRRGIDFIREQWEDLRDTFKEYYPHDPAINSSGTKRGIEGPFYSMNQMFYHGTNRDFAPGDYLMPPSRTGNIVEQERIKNLNKVFFTLDKGSAKIYADRAVNAHGTGAANVYVVMPLGEIEWINKDKGTTVLMSPCAKVIEKVQ